YLELGDGDELYENRRLADIVQAYGNIFQYLNEFHKQGRLIYIWGNHNKQFGNEKWLSRELQRARSHISDLFPDLKVYETALLGDKIFLFHGHQGDPMNDLFAFFSRFLVRTFWRPLQTGLGFRDPTSPAKNVRKRNKIEEKILEWAREHKMVAIAGHTHRPMFASLTKQQRKAGQEEEPYYFNSGSGVHPRCVTCIEIYNMRIELAKWHTIAAADDERRLRVVRETLEGCSENLEKILSLL
ncbi:MAG: metallophosphoesterase family protein, partial [Candidatus Aminicenantes bacterium]|nr:metallophosphoesterase family protein [Candidatus Aminicenantes bacterium]